MVNEEFKKGMEYMYEWAEEYIKALIKLKTYEKENPKKMLKNMKKYLKNRKDEV